MEARYGHMVHEYYVDRLRALARQRQAVLRALAGRGQAERYRDAVRRRIRRAFSPFPARSPLKVRVTGELAAGDGTIRKLIFESRPGFPVTANLYVPRGRGPFPAVLMPCGHSLAGKAGPTYQLAASGLAAQGFLTLVYDPVSQGERFQHTHWAGPWPEGHQRENPHGHNMAARQLFPIGGFFGAWRAWDGIRALDALLEQPEADRRRVGVTGNSGGGTLTTWLNALDARFTMAAPSCFVTAWRHNLENEEPADAEQCPPGLLGAGLDLADFIIARAPRPTLLLGQRDDFFDQRGLEEAYADARRIYRLLGAGDRIELFVGGGIHGFWADNRSAMYRFFGRHAGISAAPREPAAARPAESLAAAPGGQVQNLPDNRFIWELIAETARGVLAARGRRRPSGAALRRAVASALNLPPRRGAPYVRSLRWQRPAPDGHPWQTVWFHAVETEPGIQAMLQTWEPACADRYYHARLPGFPVAHVFLPHLSARDDMAAQRAPVPEDGPVVCVEARGIGTMRATTCGVDDLSAAYGQDYLYTAHGLMLGESYGGRRVHDVLCALDALAAAGTREIRLSGRGLGALLAAFAGLLHPRVRSVTLRNAPLSFAEFTQTAAIAWPPSALVWDALRAFDLPDIYRELAAEKSLALIEPWDAMMRPMPRAVCEQRLRETGGDPAWLLPTKEEHPKNADVDPDG